MPGFASFLDRTGAQHRAKEGKRWRPTHTFPWLGFAVYALRLRFVPKLVQQKPLSLAMGEKEASVPLCLRLGREGRRQRRIQLTSCLHCPGLGPVGPTSAVFDLTRGLFWLVEVAVGVGGVEEKVFSFLPPIFI